MKHLIIYCHPNPKSFNHAVKEALVGEMRSWGHDVVVRDLYEVGFDPVLKPADFENLMKGVAPADVKVEQDHIRAAETISFVFPIWWTGLPAMIKGYIDRVFVKGFAYDFGPDGPRGLLSDKKAMIFNTTGSPQAHYQQTGMFNSLNQTIAEGILQFCGMKVILHKYCCSVPFIGDGERRAMLDEIKTLARAARA